MIQTYHQSLVWFRTTISHWYDLDIFSGIDMIQTCYIWIIPITDNIPESCQWLMICLNHTNDWWYVWIIPMTDSISESYQQTYKVIGMIQVYYQWLVWLRHTISLWYDSDILTVIGMIQTYYQSLAWFGYISESYQWLRVYLNHINDW
jgi:hypothetical protein